MSKKEPNDLIHSSSPYLLQHAYNPVKWQAWSDTLIEKAVKEQKLLLISIGYSACHWCHVMERESFESHEVARLMNENFICIKVDREERPDIDQVYMLAVQLMTGRGGWPLNCFALPDGRPFYGGTYFPREQWKNVLTNIKSLWENEKDRVYDYADKLLEGMQISEIAKPEEHLTGEFNDLKDTVEAWIKRSDHKFGGPDRAPKFPLPVNYSFLLHYNHYRQSKEIEKHIRLTLNKIAAGGIYDQTGGGFARYSTDINWKVPHFEKMLYDNAQLVSLYSKAYLVYKDKRYREIVEQTLEFIEREFTGQHGEFYSALDADSEYEEGKFYIWTHAELKKLLKDDYEFFASVYDLSEDATWENDHLILMRKDMSYQEDTEARIRSINKKLLAEREKRVRPGLDDKALTSWNAMMITGYLDAYIATGNHRYLDAAKRNHQFIMQHMIDEDQSLLHAYRSGKSSVHGFLEDYAFMISALIKLYECTFNEEYLEQANRLTAISLNEFYDDVSSTFYFTSKSKSSLIVRKPEINDNVVPSSGAVMAHNLFRMAHLFSDEHYRAIAEKLAVTFKPMFINYPEGYAHWGELLINFMQPHYEIIVTGKDAEKNSASLHEHPYPSRVVMKGHTNSILPSAKEKPDTKEKTQIFVCSGKVCQAPVSTAAQALTLLV